MPVKRVIRRLPPHRFADFDDYLWSVNVALLAFGACVAEVIVFESDFHTSDLLYNGWVRLGTLTAVLGLMVWGMMRLNDYWSHRMQLSAMLALITHLWAGVYLHEQKLVAVMPAETSASFGEDEADLVTLPDYDFQTIEQQTPDETIDDPTLIEAPDAVVTEEVERETPLAQSLPERVAAEPTPTELDQPDVAPMSRPEFAAPRRSELASLGTLSRQEQMLPTTVELVDTPETASAASQAEESLSPARNELERQATTPERVNRAPSIEGAAATTPDAPALTRRNAERDPGPEGTSGATARPREVARIEGIGGDVVDTARLAGSADPGGSGPAPRVADLSRGAGGGPLQPATGPGASLAGGTAPGLREGLSPDFGGLTPSNDPRGGGRAAGPMSRSVGDGGGGSPLARSTTGGAPTIDDSAQSAAAPGRGAGGGSRDDLQPMNTGVTRGSGGIAGLTRQGNYDLELPGGGVDSNTPSAAARRAAPSDENPTGTGQNPSRPSQLARARAGSELPSSAFPAENIPNADVGGEGRGGGIEASSSAVVSRRTSAAPRGPVTASSGQSLVDIGTGESTVSRGPGRSSGGGEPTVSSSYSPGGLTRGTPGLAIGDPAAADDGGFGSGRTTGTGPGTGGGPGGEGAGGLGPAGPGGGGLARSGTGGVPARRGNGGGAPGLDPGLGSTGGTSTELSRAGGNGTDGPSIGTGAGRGGAGPGSGRSVASADAGSVLVDDPLAGGSGTGGEGTGTGTGVGSGSGQSGGGTGPIGPRGGGAGTVTRTAGGGGSLSRPGTGAGNGTGESGSGLASGLTGNGIGGGGPRRSDGSGPTIAGGAGRTGDGTGRRTATAAFDDDDAEIGPVAMTAAPNEVSGGSGGGGQGLLGPAGPAGASGVTRQRSTVATRANAPAGAGGLGSGPSVSPGIPDRRARPESEVVSTTPRRFVLERAGGTSDSIDAKADTGPVHGFRQRNPLRRGGLAEAMGGNNASEQAVELGLNFLSRHQLEDGRWSLHNLAGNKPGYQNTGAGSMKTDTAATGLSLLTFYGAGYTHSDGKYRESVRRGLDFLLTHQKENGDLFVPQDQKSAENVQFYSHGIATIALCEAYGMTRDKDLREPAQRAIDFIVASQQPSEGGWRYAPRVGSDTSVTGWQMMAMKSGELAGLNVPPKTYDKLRDWLDHAATPWGSPARYAYRPRSTQQNQAKPSLAMTAEGLLMQQYLGWQRDNAHLLDGAEYLRANLPTFGSPTERTRDCYYWYYATQVMFQMQGEYWTEWNEALRPLLIDNQVREGQFAGSWEPTGATPDRWGPHGGRLYVTCLHLLMLEVYYRHLPLYRDLTVAQGPP